MLTQGLELFGRLGFSMVLGTTLIVLATVAGWLLAGFQHFFFVRWVNFWVKRVVIPLLRTPSWSRRTVTIFANNALVLAAILLLGSWGISSRLGVVLAGLSLGVALRHLGEYTADSDSFSDPSTPGDRRRFRIGIVLNLLEIGAIVVTVGLAIGVPDSNASLAQAWTLYGFGVVPTLLVAAGGEALWMGVVRRGSDAGEEAPPANGPDVNGSGERDGTD